MAMLVVTSGCICGTGDGLSQVVVADGKHDWSRNARMAFVGATFIAPALHIWYNALATTLVRGTGHMAIAKRVLADQVVFTPAFVVVFFSYTGLLEGKPKKEIVKKVQNDWAGTVVYNWFYWVPVQLLNFGFIPLSYQVLFSNCAAVVWNGYLSYVANRR